MQLKVDRNGKKKILNKFVDGDLDVLIASQPVGEGVDKLQYVCNNIIFMTLPYTYASLEQVIGRLVRTGQKKKDVHLHIMLGSINGYAYDQKIKIERLNVKKVLGNCVVDGTIPDFSELELTTKDKKDFYDTIINNHIVHLKEIEKKNSMNFRRTS